MANIGKPVAVHVWKGHRIEIRLRSSPRYLWMTMGFFVRVDGEEVAGPPGHLERATTQTAFGVRHGDSLFHGKVESVRGFGNKFVLRTRYRLTVNGDEVGRGLLRAENWFATLGVLGIVFVVFPLAMAFWLRLTF